MDKGKDFILHHLVSSLQCHLRVRGSVRRYPVNMAGMKIRMPSCAGCQKIDEKKGQPDIRLSFFITFLRGTPADAPLAVGFVFRSAYGSIDLSAADAVHAIVCDYDKGLTLLSSSSLASGEDAFFVFFVI